MSKFSEKNIYINFFSNNDLTYMFDLKHSIIILYIGNLKGLQKVILFSEFWF